MIRHPVNVEASDLTRAAHALCREIEKLPAGDQQTRCAVMASELLEAIHEDHLRASHPEAVPPTHKATCEWMTGKSPWCTCGALAGAAPVVPSPVAAALPGEPELASALCDSSSHINTIPHAEDRPCDYHRERARNTLRLLVRRATPPGTDE